MFVSFESVVVYSSSLIHKIYVLVNGYYISLLIDFVAV